MTDRLTYHKGDITRSVRDTIAFLLLRSALKVGTQDFALYLVRIGDVERERRKQRAAQGK